MSIWSRLVGFLSGAGYRQPGIQTGMPMSYNTPSASPVTMDTALQLSVVWACVRLIAESVASLPLRLYSIGQDGQKNRIYEHPIISLFNTKVNKWQTRQEFFETLTLQLALLGNAYALKHYNNRGGLISLTPLMTEQVEVSMLEDGTLTYQYYDGVNIRVFSAERILHIKLMGNGVIGLSPLSYARNCIGLAQAAENRTTAIYSNGAKPSGVLMVDQLLKPEQREQIRANFAGMSAGNDDRLYVLEANMRYQQISMSPQDIELLESRRFQIEDIARFFGVPSVLINDASATTAWGSGIYQLMQGFYKLGLRPYLERYESAMMNSLFPPEDRTKYELEFDFSALLQADAAERYAMYKEAIQGGLLTPNEAREFEGLSPKDGGDDLFMQQQMTPITLLDGGGNINVN